MGRMQAVESSLASKLDDVLQHIIGDDALDAGSDGKVLVGFVVITDWQAIDGARGIHVVGPEQQPTYITRALLGEAARMNDEYEDDDEEDV